MGRIGKRTRPSGLFACLWTVGRPATDAAAMRATMGARSLPAGSEERCEAAAEEEKKDAPPAKWGGRNNSSAMVGTHMRRSRIGGAN